MSAPESAITALLGEAERDALDQHFQPCPAGRGAGERRRRQFVADEEVGDGKAVEVLGARRRDAARQVPRPAAVLHGRLQSSVKDFDHAALVSRKTIAKINYLYLFNMKSGVGRVNSLARLFPW